VEADQVRVELHGRVRDEAVDAVCSLSTTCSIEVAEKRSNDVNSPLATDGQNPFQIGDRRRQGDLVGHDELAHHMVPVVVQLCDLSISPYATSSHLRTLRSIDRNSASNLGQCKTSAAIA